MTVRDIRDENDKKAKVAIQKLINKKTEELNKVDSDSSWKDFGYIIGMVCAIAAGIVSVSVFSGLFLPMMSTAVMFGLGKKKRRVITEHIEARLNEEINHLKKVRDDKDGRRALKKDNGKAKIDKFLHDNKKKYENGKSKVESNKKRDTLLSLGAAAAVVCGSLFGGLAMWLAPAAAVVKWLFNDETEKNVGEHEKLAAACHNAIYDQKIIKYIDDLDARCAPPRRMSSSNAPSTRQIAKNKTYSKEQIDQVNRLVDGFEKQSSNSQEKAIQYSKK